jgi:pilus assembly protein Flp/PilA
MVLALHRNLRRFATDNRGATSIEYALIAAGIAVTIITAVGTLGETVKTTLWDKIAGAL